MAKHWREASSLIIASKINFRSNVTLRPSVLNGTRCDTDISDKSMRKLPRNNADYKILLLRRSAESSFMPSGYVFPGGTTHPSDSSEGWRKLFSDSGYSLDDLNHASYSAPVFHESRDSEITKAISLRITAIRETFEESGILLCTTRHSEGEGKRWASYLSGGKVVEWQKKVQEKPSELLNLCKEFKCVPDIWALHLWSNWLTPVTFKKRFDTVFFIAVLDQIPPTYIDDTEVDEKKWCTPSEILQEKSVLPPPQLYEISRLNNFKTLDRLANFSVERAILGCERWMPVLAKTSDGVVGFLPGDDMYPSAPELYVSSAKYFKEKLEDLRMMCVKLHRWELKGKGIQKIFASNIQPSFGHLLPVTYD